MDCFEKATQNVGNPPSAEAYCRVLAMEIERLARKDERTLIAKLICGECSMDTPIDAKGVHYRKDAFGKDFYEACDAFEIFGRGR